MLKFTVTLYDLDVAQVKTYHTVLFCPLCGFLHHLLRYLLPVSTQDKGANYTALIQ